MKTDVKDLSGMEAGHPDGNAWVAINMVKVDGKNAFQVDIRQPKTDEDALLLMGEVAALTAMTACLLSESPYTCHAGCAFVTIMEQAHRRFKQEQPEEYARVVGAGMLVPATSTGTQH